MVAEEEGTEHEVQISKRGWIRALFITRYSSEVRIHLLRNSSLEGFLKAANVNFS